MKYLAILFVICMWGCKAKKPLVKDSSLYKRYDHVGGNEDYSGLNYLLVDSNGTVIKGNIFLNHRRGLADTIPPEIFTMPYVDKGIDPPSFHLPDGFSYEYFDCQKEFKALRKELDSLKIEIQKLKSKQ